MKFNNIPSSSFFVFFAFCCFASLFFLRTLPILGQVSDYGDNAQFIGQSVPATMVAGQDYSVSVTMKNVGINNSLDWSDANHFFLGSQNPPDNVTWGTGRISFASGESIAHGQTKTFTFSVKAPATAGTYNFQWKMIWEHVNWFGESTTNVAVSVVSTGSLARGQSCVENAICASNICNNSVCCAAGECGWPAQNGNQATCTAAGGTISNTSLGGVCRSGAWKTALNGTGCSNSAYPCDQGTCQNNTCVGAANASTCSVNSDCSSGICNNKVCCNTGECGWAAQNGNPPVCVASGATKSNASENGVCRSGVWKTALSGIGCSDTAYPCDQGTCQSNMCVAPAANASTCSVNSDCSSGICNNKVCCAAGECGWGAENGNPPVCVASGGNLNNQPLGGVCRSGVWKTVLNGTGCSTAIWLCDQGVCLNNVCVAATGTNNNNGAACAQNSDCNSGVCTNKICAATCASLGFSCGSWSGNGTDLYCGACPPGNACTNNICVANGSCATHSSKKCAGGNVYWYNSCGTKEDLFENCGSNITTQNYQCDGNWLQQQVTVKDCADGACTSVPTWNNFQDCSKTGKRCRNNSCVSGLNSPPVLSDLLPQGKVYVSNIDLSLTTDEAAECRFGTKNQNFSQMAMDFNSSDKLHHSASLPLSKFGDYDYYVFCKDTAGNINPTAGRIIFNYGPAAAKTQTPATVPPSLTNTPPVISGLSPAGDVNVSAVTLACVTDQKATCKYDTKDVAYSTMKNAMQADDAGTNHSANITLAAEGSNNYYLRCQSSGGVKDTKSAVISFKYVAKIPGPVISSPLPSGQVSQKDISLAIGTDKPATCRYSTTDVDYDAMAGTFSANGQQQTAAVSLPGFGAYIYYARCADAAGNKDDSSTQITFEYINPNPDKAIGTKPGPANSTASNAAVSCKEYKLAGSDGMCDNSVNCICDPDCPDSGNADADPDCANTAKPQRGNLFWPIIIIVSVVAILSVFAAAIIIKKKKIAKTQTSNNLKQVNITDIPKPTTDYLNKTDQTDIPKPTP